MEQFPALRGSSQRRAACISLCPSGFHDTRLIGQSLYSLKPQAESAPHPPCPPLPLGAGLGEFLRSTQSLNCRIRTQTWASSIQPTVPPPLYTAGSPRKDCSTSWDERLASVGKKPPEQSRLQQPYHTRSFKAHATRRRFKGRVDGQRPHRYPASGQLRAIGCRTEVNPNLHMH